MEKSNIEKLNELISSNESDWKEKALERRKMYRDELEQTLIRMGFKNGGPFNVFKFSFANLTVEVAIDPENAMHTDYILSGRSYGPMDEHSSIESLLHGMMIFGKRIGSMEEKHRLKEKLGL